MVESGGTIEVEGETAWIVSRSSFSYTEVFEPTRRLEALIYEDMQRRVRVAYAEWRRRRG